jgi:hypothetical protein
MLRDIRNGYTEQHGMRDMVVNRGASGDISASPTSRTSFLAYSVIPAWHVGPRCYPVFQPASTVARASRHRTKTNHEHERIKCHVVPVGILTV